jgi:peptide-methionine (R)-S-oxide reductase
MNISEHEWKNKLTPLQYKVLRQKGTEPPFSGQFYKHDKQGIYSCSACGQQLFSSQSKYNSDMPGLAGWPSFSEAIKSDRVELVDDTSMDMQRVEVVCKKCGSHLGHVFDETASNSGKHYCINSVCLNFAAGEKVK